MDESDVVDGVNTIVFDQHGEERDPWTICGVTVYRSLLLFIIQVVFVICIIIVCAVKISFSATCTDSSLYISIISICIGYLLPGPNL